MRLSRDMRTLGLLPHTLTGSTRTADNYYRNQQASGFAVYPRIRLWTRPPLSDDSTLRTLYTTLPEGTYRLLLQNQDKVFMFKPPPDRKPARLAVIILALRDVHALRVLP